MAAWRGEESWRREWYIGGVKSNIESVALENNVVISKYRRRPINYILLYQREANGNGKYENK